MAAKKRKKKKSGQQKKTSNAPSRGTRIRRAVSTTAHFSTRAVATTSFCCYRSVREAIRSVLLTILIVLTIGLAYVLISLLRPHPPDPDDELFRDIFATIPFLKFGYETLMTSRLAGPEFPGAEFKGREYFPVVIIPGIISSALELWQGKSCAHAFFRQRWWGGTSMLRALLDKDCWLEHMTLTPEGKDPPGIKLRAAEGLFAADYLVPGYWVWGRIIENLALVGYDKSTIYLMSYDWRLGYKDMEERDGYFSSVMYTIELCKRRKGRRVVALTHSMGSQVFYYFLKWVEHPNGGGRGPGWVEENIESVVHVAGSLLGAPKAVSTLVSGEMRDTAQFNVLEHVLTKKILSLAERVRTSRSWFGLASLLPRGGAPIWGSSEGAADDDGSSSLPLNTMMRFADGREVYGGDVSALLSSLNSTYKERLDQFYSLEDIADNPEDNEHANSQRYWSSPLATALPRAPTTKHYCLYGVGKETERGYLYTKNLDPATNASVADVVDVESSDFDKGLYYGVQNSMAGDGTVPLVSLGYMCARGWRAKEDGTPSKFNPSNSTIITREYLHRPEWVTSEFGGRFSLRGGLYTADHVDVLGNRDLLLDLLHIVTNTDRENTLPDTFVSNISAIADRIPVHR